MFKATVIGAGPAGTSAALGLLRCGFHVTVLEHRPIVAGRVCGSFLNPEAVRHLRWLGVYEQAEAAGGIPVRTSRLSNGKEIRLDGFAFPRQDLEGILQSAVENAGGMIERGSRVMDPSQHPSDLTILADGRFTLADPQIKKPPTGWFGWNAAFEGVQQEPGDMSLHFYSGGYIGLLTFKNGVTNVCGLQQKKEGDHLQWDDVYKQAQSAQPSFKSIMNGSQRISEWRGVGPLPFSKKMRQADGLCLAGDAAAVGDPFMGEGIGRALAAGPMIFQAWQEVHKTNRPVENFHAAYRKLWQNAFASRLRLGFWSRKILGTPFLFRPAMPVLLSQNQFIQSMLPIFHGGFIS